MVSVLKSARDTACPANVPAELGIGAGTSPSGKTNPLPGSRAMTALILRFFIVARQPNPPACE
jgi:hypothetical protein